MGILVAVVALVAAAVGSAAQRSRVEEAGRARAQAEVDALVPGVIAEIETIAQAIATRAEKGAQTQPIEAIAPTIASQQQMTELANTLAGFTREEEHFAPFVGTAQTGFFLGEKLLYASNPELVEMVLPAVRMATVSGTAKTLTAHGGAAWAVGIGRSKAVNPQSLPVVVAFAEKLTSEALQQVSTARQVAVLLVPGDRLADAVGGGEAAQVDALRARYNSMKASPVPCCARKQLAPGLDLLVYKDPTPLLSAAASEGARSTPLFFGIGGVLAVVGLIFGFRGGKEADPASTELLKQTAEQLRQSQEQLQRLSQQLTISNTSRFDEAARQAVPPGDGHDDGLGSTQASVQASRYEIVAPLGEGGMARVAVAVLRGAEGFKRTFVLKRLRPELANNQEIVNQFIDEARLGASLVHSNIVPVFDFGRDADGYYLAQEYIMGRDVDALVEASKTHRGRPLELPLVVLIGQEGLKALGYAHTRKNDAGKPMGLVHRDVSPNNLMVSARGEVKLLDFGIVKSDDRVTKTQAGVVKGNLFFMSPEQARALPVDPRSDLFSMGMVLFTALTGEPIYSGNNVYDLMNRAGAGLTDDDRARVKEQAGPLAEVLLTALSNDPAERYADAEAFSRALGAVATPALQSELQALMDELFTRAFAEERQKFQVS